jgi:[ribosomal protein S18]-alanine N-acetyltransferase
VTWQLRTASVADLDDIMTIETATFPSDAWSRGSMRSELDGPHSYYLVASADDGRVEGYAGLFAPRGTGQADIQTLAVVESARGRGLGSALLTSLLDEARRREVSEVFLEVRADNEGAARLYESFGFERIAVREHYYQPDDVAAHVMRLTLGEA